MRSRLVVAVSSLFLTALAHAETRHVPVPYATIQDAIDASVDLDQVVIADGVYSGPGNVNLDLGGRAITVRSASGPAACIIDGTATPGANAFIFDGEPNAFGTIQGLTMRHFVTAAGSEGAIRIVRGRPAIRDCIFEFNATGAANSETPPGSAIWLGPDSPVVNDCIFRDNLGSAAYLGPGSVVYLIDCLYERNETWHNDGGAAISSDGFLLSFTSTFRDNTAHALTGIGRGGAIAQRGLSLDMTAPIFESNRATGPGGARGMAVHVHHQFILNGGIVRNHDTPGDGGTLCVDATDDPTLVGRVNGSFEDNASGAVKIITTEPTSNVEIASVSFCQNGPFDVEGPYVDFGGNTACCPADIDGSFAVGFTDLLAVLADWGPCPGCPTDVDADGTVGFSDLLTVLASWGACPSW